MALELRLEADDGGEDRGDRKDAKLPNLTWYRMPGCSPRSPTKTAYSFSTNRCWARDRRDDDPPRRNSAGRRVSNLAPRVTLELQTALAVSNGRAPAVVKTGEIVGGGGRIRTCEPFRASGFQDRRLQPLGHSSEAPIPDLSGLEALGSTPA